MNKKSFYFGGLLLAALTLSSCANEDTATEKTAGKDTPKSGTVFSSETEPATRTSAKYTGSGLDFYWTASDKIWVKDDNGNYNQNASDDISSRIAAVPGSTTTDKAKFWVNGSYTGSSHKVRYTGKSGVKDKVTIKASQTQSTPNDAAHIAEDGDFGVADATGSLGAYNFTLNHKAAYITFMPYTAQDAISAAKLSKIRIYTDNTSDQLAGTFDLADNGSLSNGTSTSNSVEIDLTGYVWHGGFNIPNASNSNTNAAIMVIKPGTYNNVHIEYTVADPITNVEGTITKTYPSVTFTAGKNTPVKTNLQVKVYPGDGYYQWDAQQQYWAGFEWDNPNPAKRSQPTSNVSSVNDADAPQSTINSSAHTPRDFNDVLGYSDPTGTAPAVEPNTTRFKNCPNVNEMMWYITKGDPHYDKDILWAMMGHLYQGGMWFKKKSKIPNFNSNQAPNKPIDFTRVDKLWDLDPFDYNVSAPVGRPTNLNDYFFLPSFGKYSGQNEFPGSVRGRLLGAGFLGYYWTSTPAPAVYTSSSHLLYFAYYGGNSAGIALDYEGGVWTGRGRGIPTFSTSNEDAYHPF